MRDKVDLAAALASFDEAFSPRIVAGHAEHRRRRAAPAPEIELEMGDRKSTGNRGTAG